MSYSIYTNLVDQLIPNLSIHKGPPLELDLILDNGAFNGIYLFGVLIYLKSLENIGRIHINRISGSSIGAAFGVLFLNDMLDKTSPLFSKMRTCWKANCDLSVWKSIITETCNLVDFDKCKHKINGKMYINYFDTSTSKEHIISEFNTKEELIETLFKSSYIPILVDGNVTYQNCVDGFNPTLFNERTEEDRKGLFIHLLSYEKMFTAFNVRNDKNTTFRAIEGINEIHKFFLGQYTPLCSYVNEWSYRELLTYRVRQIIYYMVIYIIRLLVISKALIPDEFYETPIWNLVSQMGSKIYKDIFFQICF